MEFLASHQKIPTKLSESSLPTIGFDWKGKRNRHNRNWRRLQNFKNLNKRWIPVGRFLETTIRFLDLHVTRVGVDVPVLVKDHSDGGDHADIPLGNFVKLSPRRKAVENDEGVFGLRYVVSITAKFGGISFFSKMMEQISPPYVACMQVDVSVSESSSYPPFEKGKMKGFLDDGANFGECFLCMSSSGCIHCLLGELL
ncbi:hypothetical protein AMTRI_Chr03g146530 [Amborella trichopoda]